MHDWLAAAANRRPHHPFLVTAEGEVTFSEMEERVRRLVGGLDRALPPSSTVGLWAGDTREAVPAVLAVPRSGRSLLLLNTRLTPGEAGRQLREAGAAALLTAGSAPELGVPPLPVASLEGPPQPPGPVDPATVHSVVFTSGSSGRPKGVRLTWANLEASAAGSALHLRHGPEDRWLAVLPIYHVGGLQILIRSAREATTVLLEPGFDPARVAARLANGDATLASLVPTMLHRVLQSHPGPYRVRAVLVGGGGILPGLLERAEAAGIPVLASYGMTETASQVATARLDAVPPRPVMPIPGAELRVREGRIEVRGPMVSPGYLGEPDRAPGEWFDTGDLGSWDPQQGLRVLGRADDLVVTGGENVMPGEVEGVLLSHPDVRQAAVVGIPDPEWGEVVAAAVVVAAATTVDELERFLRERLAGYKVPRRWLQLPSLPQAGLGKIDRQAVKRLLTRP